MTSAPTAAATRLPFRLIPPKDIGARYSRGDHWYGPARMIARFWISTERAIVTIVAYSKRRDSSYLNIGARRTRWTTMPSAKTTSIAIGKARYQRSEPSRSVIA